MIDILEYIQLPISKRQEHLRLDEPCIERGGQSMYCKGLLAHIHNTTTPSGKKIHVCHACHNAACTNPNHLYWGTASENAKDRDSVYKISIWDKMVAKYGEEGARSKMRRDPSHYARIGRNGNLGRPKSEVQKEKISISLKKNNAA